MVQEIKLIEGYDRIKASMKMPQQLSGDETTCIPT